ncbi:unnamed protein product [Moneuplotes crassus]|uniref:Uncharacterized protein n=1 Tax=Euplotes crassus TaxID=5936 RepID=A0AAD1X8T0_EUPCR|nr:unnamed protein product [Moneuplotes crassus]
MDQFDENLPDELLNEGAVVLRVKTTSHLTQNMSCTPFKSTKAVHLVSQVCLKKHNQDTSNKKPIIGTKLPSKKIHSQGPPCNSQVQMDIRSLLQKAIKIRNFYADDSDSSGSSPFNFAAKLHPELEDFNDVPVIKRGRLEKHHSFKNIDITMRDIKSAQ